MDNSEKNKDIENMDIELDESTNNPFKQENVEDVKEDSVLEEETEDSEDKVSKEIYDKLNAQYVRLAADFDNYRKRQAQERENLLKYGLEESLKKMILVLDNFDRAKQSLKDCEDYTKYKESIELLHKQVCDELNKLGMEKIDAEGKEFDPNFHEAIMQTPTAEYPDNTVIKELQLGYKLGDKVLRPSMVNVAVGE